MSSARDFNIKLNSNRTEKQKMIVPIRELTLNSNVSRFPVMLAHAILILKSFILFISIIFFFYFLALPSYCGISSSMLTFIYSLRLITFDYRQHRRLFDSMFHSKRMIFILFLFLLRFNASCSLLTNYQGKIKAKKHQRKQNKNKNVCFFFLSSHSKFIWSTQPILQNVFIFIRLHFDTYRFHAIENNSSSK